MFLRMMEDMLTDWPIGTILGIVLIACILIIAALVVYLLFLAADSWFLPRKRKKGHVVEKTFTPTHTTTTVVMVGKIMVPSTTRRPDKWSITVAVDGQEDSISIAKEAFDSLSNGDSVEAEYVIGRLSGDIYIKDVIF